MAIHEMKSAAQSANDRQRGLSVLERQAEGERIAAEKEAARRQRKAARRSQSTPPQKDKNGGELARGSGRQRINQTIGRSSGGSGMLERRSRSLMSKKDFRRSVLVNAVAPAGGVVLSRCPERTDDAFEQGTAAGTAAHAEAVRAWIKGNLSDAGSELRTIDQKDRNVMLFNDWLGQSGYEQVGDWVKDADGWKAVCRVDEELLPCVPSAESLIEYAFKMANGDREKCPKGGRPDYRNCEW